MSDPATTYALLDSGQFEKLEQVGPYKLVRPCPQAVWPRVRPPGDWESADAVYLRSDSGGGQWQTRTELPPTWTAGVHGQAWQIKPTGFGHLGIFPEQESNWGWLQGQTHRLPDGCRALNLFAYTGGSTMAMAHAGARVTHVDAARGVVNWARDNARAQHLPETAAQWVVEDVMKFCHREERRGRHYHGIVLDPPTFGRGPSHELWKLESDLPDLLTVCRQLLEPGTPGFVLLSSHTPGFTPLVLRNLIEATLGAGRVECGEMTIPETPAGRLLPSGCFGRWSSQ